MEVFKVIALFILLCGFSHSVKSQADCRYGLKFIVRDEAGKTIENAKLELIGLDSKTRLPSYVKLIRLNDAYVFTSHAGQTVNGNFQVKISADSFSVYEQKVNFPVCKIQTFEIKLKVLENTGKLITLSGVTFANARNAVLSGNVYDANGSLIVQAKVTAINERGEKFETLTNDEGIYVLNLPFNQYNSKDNFKIAKYEITVTKEGFEKNLMRDFKFVPSSKSKMNLDFALDVSVKINPILIDSRNEKIKKEISSLVKGLVTDESGAVVPFLTIDFKDINGKIIETKSDDRGEYTIKLPQGVFIISAKIEVKSLLLKSKEIKIEIKSADEKKQDLILYCIKGNCPVITTSSGRG